MEKILAIHGECDLGICRITALSDKAARYYMRICDTLVNRVPAIKESILDEDMVKELEYFELVYRHPKHHMLFVGRLERGARKVAKDILDED